MGKKDRKPSKWPEGSKKSNRATPRRERKVGHPKAEEHNRKGTRQG